MPMPKKRESFTKRVYRNIDRTVGRVAPRVSQGIDKIVETIDPVTAIKRKAARASIAAYSGQWNGASRSRPQTQNWSTLAGDADTDSLDDLPLLRERSSDLMRNSPIAKGAIETKCDSIIGVGLRPHPTIDYKYLGLTQEQAKEFNRQARRYFKTWADSEHCDTEKAGNFWAKQNLTLRSAFEKGDVFCIIPMMQQEYFPYETRIQLIEAERCSNPNDQIDTERLVAGVEKDNAGAPVKYHFLTKSPGSRIGDYSRDWTGINAYSPNGRRNVLHIYDQLRPGATRGIPDLASIIEPLKQLTEYTEAELQAAIISGMFTVFVKTETGEQTAPWQKPTPSGTNPEQSELGYGAIVDLADNESIDTANPGRPNGNFDPFVLAILRQIGIGLSLPYELLIKHFTASYSASRAALIEAWKMFKSRRKWFADKFCHPIYEAVITEGVLKGDLYAPGFVEDYHVRRAYLKAVWTGDAQPQLDPLKESKAATEKINNKTSNVEIESSLMMGLDWEDEVYPGIVKQNELLLEFCSSEEDDNPEGLFDDE